MIGETLNHVLHAYSDKACHVIYIGLEEDFDSEIVVRLQESMSEVFIVCNRMKLKVESSEE